MKVNIDYWDDALVLEAYSIVKKNAREERLANKIKECEAYS